MKCNIILLFFLFGLNNSFCTIKNELGLFEYPDYINFTEPNQDSNITYFKSFPEANTDISCYDQLYKETFKNIPEKKVKISYFDQLFEIIKCYRVFKHLYKKRFSNSPVQA
jgi:hypothetical protein